MNTLIFVVGPTATGKTTFSLELAKQALSLKNEDDLTKFNGIDLISADSRQVYKELKILSGADVPLDFEQISLKDETKKIFDFEYFENKRLSIKLHGVSILNSNDQWSLAHFKNFATKIIINSFKENRLPIILGGTNLYLNNLFNKDSKLYIPPNNELRRKAKKMSLEELQFWLKSLNFKKYHSMNNSDVNNPRRLIRAIEIYLGEPETKKMVALPKNIKIIKLGITASLKEISNKIDQRVISRFDNGAVSEAKKIFNICKNNEFQICTTLGLSELFLYVQGEITKHECLKRWALSEFQYAKRQLVWLKKERNIVWLDDSNKSSYTLKSKL